MKPMLLSRMYLCEDKSNQAKITSYFIKSDKRRFRTLEKACALSIKKYINHLKKRGL